MAYQSEAALEQQFIEQLNKQEYTTVAIPDYDALVENFKVQFEAFNAPKLDTPITDKEWERIFNLMLGKSVFQSAKILRDKFVLEREDGTKVYLSFFDQDHTKNIFQVTHQTTVVGKYVNRYDVTILVNGLPLIQVELKRRGIDIREAVNQVMRYKKHSYNGLYHNEMYGTNFSTDTFSAYHKDISDRVKGKKTKSLDILIVVNMFLTGFDSKQLSVLYVDKDLKYHDLLQAYSRTNRVEKETKPFGIIICYRNLKKRTDDALTLFSKSQDTSGIVVPGYQYFVEKFNEMVMKLKEIALFPESVDTMQNEDDQKKFVVTFRELTKYLQSLQTFIEFSFDQDALIMSEQEYQDYKSKYLMLYSRQKTDREVVSVLNDVDFCIELMESDRINVAYIMNLIRNIHFDDPKQKDYDIKHIKDELGRTDNPQLLRKVEILQAFLDRVVVGLESADEIDAACTSWRTSVSMSMANLLRRARLTLPLFSTWFTTWMRTDEPSFFCRMASCSVVLLRK